MDKKPLTLVIDDTFTTIEKFIVGKINYKFQLIDYITTKHEIKQLEQLFTEQYRSLVPAILTAEEYKKEELCDRYEFRNDNILVKIYKTRNLQLKITILKEKLFLMKLHMKKEEEVDDQAHSTYYVSRNTKPSILHNADTLREIDYAAYKRRLEEEKVASYKGCFCKEVKRRRISVDNN